MFFKGLAIPEPCVILAEEIRGPCIERNKWRGTWGNPGKPESKENQGFQKNSSPRGEGGEGRVRNW